MEINCDLTCGFCNEALGFNGGLEENDLTTHKNKEIYEIACDIFGGKRLTIPYACHSCIISLHSTLMFKKIVMKQNHELEHSTTIIGALRKFTGSLEEEVEPQIIDGILMIVPKSRQITIQNYKMMKRVFLPEVSLESLKPESSANDFDGDAMMADEGLDYAEMVKCEIKPEKLEPETIELNNFSTFNDSQPSNSFEMNNSEIKTEEEETSYNYQSSESSDQQISVFPPNFNHSDYKSREVYEKPSEEEKQWILSKILKKRALIVQRNGSWIFFRCTVCRKRFLTHIGAYEHIFLYHLRNKPEAKPYHDPNLTSDENEFIIKNIYKSRRDNAQMGMCKLCNKKFKYYQQCKEHMITQHLNKKLTEVFTVPMILKISNKGKVEGGYHCIICHDRGIEELFKKKPEINSHLRKHDKEELKIYANDQNFVKPFDHPFTFMNI